MAHRHTDFTSEERFQTVECLHAGLKQLVLAFRRNDVLEWQFAPDFYEASFPLYKFGKFGFRHLWSLEYRGFALSTVLNAALEPMDIGKFAALLSVRYCN